MQEPNDGGELEDRSDRLVETTAVNLVMNPIVFQVASLGENRTDRDASLSDRLRRVSSREKPRKRYADKLDNKLVRDGRLQEQLTEALTIEATRQR